MTNILHMQSGGAAGKVCLTLSGELDLANAPQIEEAIRKLEAERPPLLIIDLSSLGFMDSTGLHLLLEAHSRARDSNRRLALICGPPAVQRVFQIAGIDKYLSFFDDSHALTHHSDASDRIGPSSTTPG